jgi:hypothetical protein
MLSLSLQVVNIIGIVALSADHPLPPSRQESSKAPVPIPDDPINIHLGSITNQSLPSNVKLTSEPSRSNLTVESNQECMDTSATVIVINPRHHASQPSRPNDNKQIWRKREVVRQERTVYYTTVDDQGALQVQ